MRRRRSTPARVVAFEDLLTALPELRARHDLLVSTGLSMTRAGMKRERDGTWTVRVVWRRRGEPVSVSVTHEERGLVLT